MVLDLVAKTHTTQLDISEASLFSTASGILLLCHYFASVMTYGTALLRWSFKRHPFTINSNVSSNLSAYSSSIYLQWRQLQRGPHYAIDPHRLSINLLFIITSLFNGHRASSLVPKFKWQSMQ